MSQQYLVRRDTTAWRMQVWISFGLAVLACANGISRLPSDNVDHVSVALGFLFCLFASFTLAKTIRDNRDEKVDTSEWMIITWMGFLASVGLTAYHLLRLSTDDWVRGYMVISWLFLVSTVFTLAKAVRDKHDGDLMEVASRVDDQNA